MVSIYENFVDEKVEEARVAQDSIRSLRKCFRHGNPNTIVKTAVNLLGHPVGKCRAPFNHVPEICIEELKAVLEENREAGMR